MMVKVLFLLMVSTLIVPTDGAPKLEDAIFERMMVIAPPGDTPFSVEPAPCGPESKGSAESRLLRGEAIPSPHYGGCVRLERLETAKARYREAARALALELEVYEPAARDRKAGLVLGIGTYESGWREDVQVGRGRNGKPSEDGGQGRGPSNEACFMQIHPERGGGAELLGLDSDATRRCFRKALAMLDDSERKCGKDFTRIVSYYASGRFCTLRSDKVMKRAQLAQKTYWQLTRRHHKS